MRISVRGIPATGLALNKELDAEGIGLNADDVELLSPIAVKAKLNRIDDTVLAKVKLASKFAASCGRCLEPLEKDLSREVEFDYMLDKATEFIDLGEDIRQEIILSANEFTLCSAECKGICAGCGVNLNKEKCRCGAKSGS